MKELEIQASQLQEKRSLMRSHYVTICLACGIGALVAPLVLAALDQKSSAVRPSEATATAAQGRYIVAVGGCNNCHTPGFTEANGKTPESDWLAGTNVGYYGPWGTTYPPNLRLFVAGVSSEDAWVKFAHDLKTLPPMPWWVLHEMRDSDLRDMYRLIKDLGPKGQDAPPDRPPGQKPKVPYVEFVLKAGG